MRVDGGIDIAAARKIDNDMALVARQAVDGIIGDNLIVEIEAFDKIRVPVRGQGANGDALDRIGLEQPGQRDGSLGGRRGQRDGAGTKGVLVTQECRQQE